MHRPLLASVLFYAVFCAGCAAAEAEPEAGSTDSAIVGDNRADGEHPEVVQVNTGTGWCTGTLIGARTVLTARHCINWLDVPGQGTKCDLYVTIDKKGYGARDSHAETIAALRCDTAPDESDDARDIATIQLERPVKGVAPAALAVDGMPSGHYDTYGYGSFGRATVTAGKPDCELSNDGHKRTASYDGPLGFHFGQVSCPGDSGAPHFIRGTSVVAGVTSRATRVVLATYEKNAGVVANREWIIDRLNEYEP